MSKSMYFIHCFESTLYRGNAFANQIITKFLCANLLGKNLDLQNKYIQGDHFIDAFIALKRATLKSFKTRPFPQNKSLVQIRSTCIKSREKGNNVSKKYMKTVFCWLAAMLC